MFAINILVISPGSTALDATGESKSGAFPLPPRPVGRKVNFKVNYFIFLHFPGIRTCSSSPNVSVTSWLSLSLGHWDVSACCREEKGYKNYTFAKMIYDARFVFHNPPACLTHRRQSFANRGCKFRASWFRGYCLGWSGEKIRIAHAVDSSVLLKNQRATDDGLTF